MLSGYYYRVTWLVISLFFSSECFAALPVFTGRMNCAVRGVIQTKLHKKFPFAANDPRFNLAMTAIEVGVTVGTGAAVSAAWPEILLLLGVNALVSYAVPLVVNKLRNWIFTDNYKIMDIGSQNLSPGPINVSHIPQADYYAHTRRGGNFFNPYKIPVGSFMYMIDTYGYLAQYSKSRLSVENAYVYNPARGEIVGSNPFSYKTIYINGTAYQEPDVSDFLFIRHVLDNKGERIYMRGLNAIDLSNYEEKTASNVIADLPEEIFQEKLSPDMLALAANSVWRSANLEGQSENLDWSVDDPITVEDVQEWLDLHPELSPTVGDFVAPAAPPEAAAISLDFSTNYKPMSMPSVAPNLAAAFTPASNVVPDASYDAADHCAANENMEQDQNQDPDPDEDPDTSPPELEDIPTAWMILEPILNLMSDLKNFSVPAHITVCPVASFTALGNEYHIQAHCDLIEQNRVVIESVMLLAWAITALFIVLRA